MALTTTATLITFILYCIILPGIGLYFCRPDDSIASYLLGKRGMGAWVTALSTQASDMSGWLLMGLSALIGMVTGTIVLVAWKQAGLRERMYEIVPGFVANSMTILLVNCVFHQKNALVSLQFDEVAGAFRAARANEVEAIPEYGRTSQDEGG
jgi:Na+/proline symporter